MDLHSKKCGRCEQVKAITQFRLVQSQCKGVAGYCFTCEKEYNKLRYQQNKQKQIENSKEHYQQNKEAAKKRNAANKKKIEQRFRKGIVTKAKAAKLKPPYGTLVGCSSKELYDYVFSLTVYPMTEENYGDVWQLTKIRPTKDFADPRDAFHYKNFAPTLHVDKPPKTCKKCSVERPLTEFAKNPIGKTLRDTCKTCMYHQREKQPKEEVRRKKREYRRMKTKTDPAFKIKERLRKRMEKFISGSPVSVSRSVGCSKQQLKEHLESQWKEGMDWQNYGSHWVIDHIKPLAAFDLKDPEEIKKCCHYTNLQPLTVEENSKKGSVYQGVDYKKRIVAPKD